MKKRQLDSRQSAQIVRGESPRSTPVDRFGEVLTHCGQGCVLKTRLLLPEHLLDAYKQGVAAAYPNITVGDPRDSATVLGPLIREQQRQRVEGYVQSAHDEGAELLCGGRRPEGMDTGFFYSRPCSWHQRLRSPGGDLPRRCSPWCRNRTDRRRRALANDSSTGSARGRVGQHRPASTCPPGPAVIYRESIGEPRPRQSRRGAGPGWGEDMKGIGQSGGLRRHKRRGSGREWGPTALDDFTEVKNILLELVRFM